MQHRHVQRNQQGLLLGLAALTEVPNYEAVHLRLLVFMYVQLSSDATDGTGKLRNPKGKVSRIYILILEGKIDWGLGGGSNPVMQLCGFYAQYLKGLWTSSAVAETILPAVGVEIYGHGIR